MSDLDEVAEKFDGLKHSIKKTLMWSIAGLCVLAAYSIGFKPNFWLVEILFSLFCFSAGVSWGAFAILWAISPFIEDRIAELRSARQ